MNTFSWKTLNNDKWSVYARYGHIVYLVINYGGKQTKNGELLGTLASGYRPTWAMAVRNAFDNQSGEIVIDTDGTVVFESNIGSADYVRIGASFIAS